jgi:hypothetical protein
MFNESHPYLTVLNIFTGPYAELYIAAISAVVFFLLLAWYLKVQGRKELIQDAEKTAASQPLNSNVPMNNHTSSESERSNSFVSQNPEMRRLQLQAYERLIILCERLSFNALLSRLLAGTGNAKELKQLMIQTIQSEFEYNTSQQLYVSNQAWDAIKNLKEQQIFIINQLAENLDEKTPGTELASRITTLISHDENATLQPIVAALLNKEAKMLLQVF